MSQDAADRDSAVMAELAAILRREFLDPNVTISRATTADDVAGWDSLSHVRLLVHIEKHFRIRFAPLEADRLKNVGDLADLIATKRESPGG